MNIIPIANRFCIDGKAIDAQPVSTGHINDTYIVPTDAGAKYVLQRINTAVFKNPAALMQNIAGVTSFLAKSIERNGGYPERECLALIPPKDGGLYVTSGKMYFRMYAYISGTRSMERVAKKEQFADAGRIFGRFLKMLDGFPPQNLKETIPFFHNTPKYYEKLEKIIVTDPCKLAESAESEILLLREKAADIDALVKAQKQKLVPLRVTHNDTKLNNVLFDSATGKAVCVVDLDTVMPGLAMYDFGDAIRTGAAKCAEDEEDSSKAGIDLELFAAYASGYLTECEDLLSINEKELLPLSVRIMTFESAVRFLTDYLEGSVYFKVEYPGHNLVRARTQLGLLKDIDSKMRDMDRIISEYL